jgi:preprotein translocase subunit SecG
MDLTLLLIIVSILLISIVLLQSGKAESAGSIISGGSENLFSNRKERGSELFISRLTLGLGIAFFVLCLLIGF